MSMFITLITDCKDQNALGRSTTRLSTLFSSQVTTIGLNSDLEAAGNLIDVLDASGGEEGVILVNVAPRHEQAKKWENGTPFGYFKNGKTLVIASIDGLTLSLVKKFKVVDKVNMFDIPEVLEYLKREVIVDDHLYNHIRNTQFRSFEFLPRVAKWLFDGLDLPTSKYSLSGIPNPPSAIWWVDNFGNCKTTILAEEFEFKEGEKGQTSFGKLTCYNRLKDVPDHTTALIIGSSGLGDKRFLEVVIQGGSAALSLQIKSGQEFQ